MDKPLIIPFFIPHAGCPFTCIFCNQWEISGAEEIARPEEIRPRVISYLAAHKKKSSWCEVAFFGGSFTGLALELQNELLQAAHLLKDEGIIQGIRLSTRPDYINHQIVQNLVVHGVTTVELGVQSLVDEVLEKSCRGNCSQDVVEATRALRDYPIELIFQLMPGLPGDSRAYAQLTANRVVQLAPDGVRIYPTLVMKGTALETWYKEGLYQPWSLDEAVEIGAEWLGIFSAYKIKVIRLGLQATDNLSPEADFLAGPYHPAYGELVKSRLFLEQLTTILDSLEDSSGPLTIYCNPRDYSKVTGQRSINVRKLTQTYNISRINIKADPDLSPMDLRIATLDETKALSRQEFLKKYRI